MTHKRGLTLRMVFGLALLSLALLLGWLFWLFTQGTRSAILEASEKLREGASMRIETQVATYLRQASAAVQAFETELESGSLSPRFRTGDALPSERDLDAMEAWFFAELERRPTLTELTVTWARSLGRDSDGNMKIAPRRCQLSLLRQVDGAVWTGRIVVDGDRRDGWERKRRADQGVFAVPLVKRTETPDDPTASNTFLTPTRGDFYGRALWSDLFRSPLDPQRVVVTLQKTVEDVPGRFAGVIRVGLSTSRLDDIGRLPPGDPHTVFICDTKGRLITRIPGVDFRLVETDEDLRWASSSMPSALQMVLAAVPQQDLKSGRSTSMRIDPPGGRPWEDDSWLATFRGLEGSQDWVVGIAVPEVAYLGSVIEERNRMLLTCLGVMTVIVLSGVLTLRVIRRSLDRVVSQAGQMAAFDFHPSAGDSRLKDVQSVLESLEGAKTALRAMGKYVPVDLVAWLYRRNHDPELGGELRDLTLLFTDLQNFTTLSEKLSPQELAHTLGLYFECMARAIHDARGTIDKYIGDSIMAMWNAPEACDRHAERACHAVLACMKAEAALYASPAWKGMAPLVTRFGLHRDEVMVGHFGSPDRLSYTALGDGVNLASRLEGLNKIYGTRCLVSETVYLEARDSCTFRHIDRVAVKGRTQGIEVFELIEDGTLHPRMIAVYEQALEAYRERRFEHVIGLLESQRELDPPSAVLTQRCAVMLEIPPPQDWDGVYTAVSK